MTDEILRDEEVSDVLDAARMRRIRIEGEMELAASAIERSYDLCASEAALHAVRVHMARVFRHNGPDDYACFVGKLIGMLQDQKAELERIEVDDIRRRAH